MENKLGIDEESLENIEEKLFKFKSSLLSDRITFNTSGFNLDYLIRLHDYLFGDLYYDTDKLSNRIDNRDEIENKIKEIIDMIIYRADLDIIKDSINDLIDMQIFDDGNNRTIKLFFKNIIKSYYKDDDYFEELFKNHSL